ncbi:glutamine-hydrolyzing asparagine synthase, partial [mine drainage metagenome]
MDSAARLHRDLSVVEVSEYQVLEVAKKIMAIDPGITMKDLGFETVLYLTLSGIREDTLVTGQGADEIFYGYHRFLTGSSGTNDTSIRKLLNTTMPREKKIAESLHKKIIAPYLEDGIFEYSSLGIGKHIVEGTNKFLLRSAA